MAVGTDTMIKVTQVATGVAGTPYYLSAYFNASVSTPQACADAWRNLLMPVASTYTAPYTFLAVTEVGLVNAINGDLVGTEPVTLPQLIGTGAGEPLPAATSLLIRWRSGEYVGGREIRGRTNVARLAEADSTNGVPSSSLLTTWQGRLTTFLAAANAKHVVWSPKNGTWAATTAGNVWGQWAVLRSRRD